MANRCSVCDINLKLCRDKPPAPHGVMLVAEKPGVQEAARGRVLVGDTGKELDQTYLPLAGLDRRDVYCTNVLKCHLGGSNSKPTLAQVHACASHHLPDEVAQCNPTVIVLLGTTACELVPEIELDKQHGIPVYFDGSDSHPYFGYWSGWLFPCYHPAVGLHQTSMMIHMLADFKRLGLWLNELWKLPETNIPTDYSLAETIFDIDRQFEYGISYPYIPIDTESDGAIPWSLQFSLRPGHGCMVMADRPVLLRRLARLISGCGLMLHHSIADIYPLESMGIPTNAKAIRDTMQEAYHLGNLPQGLKALAFRQLGLRMRSWEDVVMPSSRRKMVEWLTDEWLEEEEHPLVVEKQLKTKVKLLYKRNPKCRDLKRILSHSYKPTYDLWEKASEADLTGYPIPSIAHAPLSEAIQYACADADATGRIGTWLEEERARIIQEEWKVSGVDMDA